MPESHEERLDGLGGGQEKEKTDSLHEGEASGGKQISGLRDAEESRHGPEKKRKRQSEANKHVKELGTKESLVRRDVISEVNTGSVTAYAYPLKKRIRTLKAKIRYMKDRVEGVLSLRLTSLNRIQSHQGGMKARNSDGHGAEVPFHADIRHVHAAGAANVNDSSHAAQSLTASSTSKLYSHSSHVFLH